MPHKVNYGFDDDNDYDYYDEDDDYYLEDEDDKVEHVVPNSSIWRCSICTYDNDQTLLFCDICGTVRNASTTSSVNESKKADDVVSGAKHSSGVKLEGNLPKLKNSSGTISNVSSGKRSSSDMRNATVEVTRVKKIESSSIVVKKSNMMRDNYSSTVEDSIQASTSGLGKLSLGTNSAKTIMNPRRCASSAEHKPENWELPNNGEEISRQLTIAVIGHVDSGKSTLSGILLHLMGKVSQKEMHKYEKESREKGKGSFSYAWVMDESAGERERGVTMTVGVAHLKTKKYDVVLLDSPGHKDLVPNMISGAVQADAAILVIDASVGSFEAGMEGNGVGQTKEHAQLIRSFGVEQLIVAVNKMDVVDYSFERFKFVKSELEVFLKTCGFKESSVSWIPLSAMENQNLMAPASDSRLSSWYPGPHLLSVIDFLQPPVRDIQKPLCLPICDVMPSEVPGLLAVSGKVEGGAVKSGCTVLVMPSGGTATVHSIVCNSLPCSVVRAGDNVSVNLQGINEDGLVSGGVLCHPNFPISVATHLELKILVLDVAVPILVGTQVEFHMHHAKETARVLKISSAIDPKSGKVSKRASRFLLAKQSAVIEVTLDRPTCASTFAENRALGRVSLRLTGNTVAVGIVNRILE